MNKNLILIFLVVAAIAFGIFKSTSSKNTPIIEPQNEIPIKEEPIVNNQLEPQEGLPEIVEAKRQAIHKATLAKDYDVLAKEASDPFMYSFGGDFEGGFAGLMRYVEKDGGGRAYDIIPILIKQPYTKQGDIYTWPSVFTKRADEWTEEDVKMMKTYLSDEQIKGYREFGAYIYYRLGITTDGKWIFYLAGD